MTEEQQALEWLKKQLVNHPPRHQHTGPFRKGPRMYVPCPICTQMAVSIDSTFKGVVGTAKQTQRQHMKDHREGHIRKPTLAPA